MAKTVLSTINNAIKDMGLEIVILDKATLNDIDNLIKQAREKDSTSKDDYTYWIEVESKSAGEKITTVVLQSPEEKDISKVLNWLACLQYLNPYNYHFYLVVNYEIDCTNVIEFVPKK